MAMKYGQHLLKRAMGQDMDKLRSEVREEQRLSPIDRAINFSKEFNPEESGDVLRLQRLLNKSEITDYEGQPLEEDAIFGPRTESSLRNLQEMPPQRKYRMGVGAGLEGVGGVLGIMLGKKLRDE
jgi:hypothetical protein